MTVEMIRMSSKGQIVIPQDLREEMHADEGTVFAVVGNGDTIVLRKLNTPSKEDLIKDLGIFAKKSRLKLQHKGFTHENLQAK